MDPPTQVTREDPLEKAKYKWTNGYHASDDAFDLVVKELEELTHAILFIRRTRAALATRFQQIYDTETSSQLPFQIQLLIQEGDFIMKQREDLYNWALRLNNSDLIQDMKNSCKK